MAVRDRLKRRGTPRLLRDFHLISVGFWIVMIPVSIVTGLWKSVAFVTLISLWALVSTEAGAYQASRAEVKVVDIDAETANVTANDVNVQS